MAKDEILPELTHLQFLVLGIIGSGTMSGKELRESLKAEAGIMKSGPAFYQMMARLEEGKFIRGWYEQEVIDGQIFKERHYEVLVGGVRALKQTEAFYRRHAAIGGLG